MFHAQKLIKVHQINFFRYLYSFFTISFFGEAKLCKLMLKSLKNTTIIIFHFTISLVGVLRDGNFNFYFI